MFESNYGSHLNLSSSEPSLLLSSVSGLGLFDLSQNCVTPRHKRYFEMQCYRRLVLPNPVDSWRVLENDGEELEELPPPPPNRPPDLRSTVSGCVRG